jgi:Asp-tRNA(Asn)/Glu-tRNA(Gln) amidotransferase A subunit family amidase
VNETLHTLSATAIARGLRTGQFTARELTQACFAQIERLDSILKAWVHLDLEKALLQADAADARLRAGQAPALTGVPVGIKDIFNTVDMPTQMGSPIWAGFTPGNDARVVHYLRLAGAVFPGKTVTAEFAVHAPGPTANPHNPLHMPGTSSSGSAAATAAFMVPAALGTQTAGSIIRPASYCGVYGFKPSFGLIPRTGMLKTTDTLDTIGVFARAIDDLAVLFDAIRVKGRDHPLSEAALNDHARQTKVGRPWRVALVRGPKWSSAEEHAQVALLDFARRLEADPDIVVETITEPPIFERAHEVHAAIYDRALAYYFKEEFLRHTLVSPVMYASIDRGNALTLADYLAALEEQKSISRTMEEFFLSGYDIVLNLSTGGEALKGLDSTDRLDNCLIWTLCGLPAINLPVFSGPQGLPFGAQIVGRRYNDYMLLDFARHLESRGVVQSVPFPVPKLDFVN